MINMPRRGGRHQVLVKGAEAAMTAFKMEIAEDLGLLDKIDTDGSFKQMSTVEVGQIGGEMVRRIQAAGEYAIKQRYDQGMDRLMPEEVLPNPKAIRTVTNNGNPSVDISKDISQTPNSGQQWEPKGDMGTGANGNDTHVRYAPRRGSRAVEGNTQYISQADEAPMDSKYQQ